MNVVGTKTFQIETFAYADKLTSVQTVGVLDVEDAAEKAVEALRATGDTLARIYEGHPGAGLTFCALVVVDRPVTQTGSRR